MATVIPVEKLMKGLAVLSAGDTVCVQLKNTDTSFVDKQSGWSISGSEIKKLPDGPSSRYSQKIICAIRAGRFIKVMKPLGDDTESKDYGYEDLVQSIIGSCDIPCDIVTAEDTVADEETTGVEDSEAVGDSETIDDSVALDDPVVSKKVTPKPTANTAKPVKAKPNKARPVKNTKSKKA
jgi:hypothetical protein